MPERGGSKLIRNRTDRSKVTTCIYGTLETMANRQWIASSVGVSIRHGLMPIVAFLTDIPEGDAQAP